LNSVQIEKFSQLIKDQSVWKSIVYLQVDKFVVSGSWRQRRNGGRVS